MARVKTGVPTVKELREGESEHRYVSGTGLVAYTRHENQLYSSKMYPSSVPPIIDKKASSIIRNSETVNITIGELELDFGSLISGVLADGDYILYIDTTSGSEVRKESLSDLSTLLAGTGLDVSSSVLNVNLTDAVETAIADGDYITFFDGGSTGTLKKEALADVATLFAGNGLDAASSILSVDVSDFMASGVNNRVLTATGTDAFQGESGLTFVSDILTLTADSSAFKMGAGTDFTITHDGTTGATLAGNPITITSAGAATWSTSAGNLTVDSAAAVLVLDGHTGITLDASNSGNVEINVTAGDDILIGNDAVAVDVKLGQAAATEIDLTAILVDINGGASGVTIDGGAASNFTTSAGAITIDSQASTVTVDGHTGVTVQSSNSGDITLDSVADIVLDAAGGNFEFKDATVGKLTIDVDTTAGDVDINLVADGDDLVFNQRDGNEVLRLTDTEVVGIRNSYITDHAINSKPASNGRHFATGDADYEQNYSWIGLYDQIALAAEHDADFGSWAPS